MTTAPPGGDVRQRDPNDNFRNRRRMAWCSFAMLAGVTLVMLGRLALGDDPTPWTGIATMVLGCFTGIVGTYAVTATVEHVKKHDRQDPQTHQ